MSKFNRLRRLAHPSAAPTGAPQPTSQVLQHTHAAVDDLFISEIARLIGEMHDAYQRAVFDVAHEIDTPESRQRWLAYLMAAGSIGALRTQLCNRCAACAYDYGVSDQIEQLAAGEVKTLAGTSLLKGVIQP